MREWVKTLIGGVCVLTILIHLIPEGRFAKYVRFYAGLLFFLMAAGPVLGWFAGEGELERLLTMEFLKEDYYDLETAVEGMSELKNDRIRESYQREILRQLQEIARAYGSPGAKVEAVFDREGGYALEGVSIRTEAGEQVNGDGLRQEIAGVYGLSGKEIAITGQEGEKM